jgi:hypothetical protein
VLSLPRCIYVVTRSRPYPLHPIHSDAYKHLPLPEPPAEGPEDGEDEEALHEGAGGAFEESVAEPGAADAADPAGGELIGDVDGDGVHADDDEREGPGFVALDVDDVVEEGEGPEDDGTAVKCPGGRPEAFDDGAEGGVRTRGQAAPFGERT